MMLPGRATLSVCDLPPVGVKTAEGFEVSMLPLRLGCCSWELLRLYGDPVSSGTAKAACMKAYLGFARLHGCQLCWLPLDVRELTISSKLMQELDEPLGLQCSTFFAAQASIAMEPEPTSPHNPFFYAPGASRSYVILLGTEQRGNVSKGIETVFGGWGKLVH